MPKRELKRPGQVIEWLMEWGTQLQTPCNLILIGYGGLLWHAAERNIDTELPEQSMDGEPRDLKHAKWAVTVGLVPSHILS